MEVNREGKLRGSEVLKGRTVEELAGEGDDWLEVCGEEEGLAGGEVRSEAVSVVTRRAETRCGGISPAGDRRRDGTEAPSCVPPLPAPPARRREAARHAKPNEYQWQAASRTERLEE